MTKHIMIDIETLSSEPNAVIATIGAKVFTLEDTDGLNFYERVDTYSHQLLGGHIDARTVCWWLQQSEKARKEIFDPLLRQHISVALTNLSAFVKQQGPDCEVWGNGSDFDNVVLVQAYRAAVLPVPWSFRQHRCYRTLKKLINWIKPKDNYEPHHALLDATTQAEHAVEMLRALETLRMPGA